MGKFAISKNTNGEFKYEFLNNNEQVVFEKSGYKNKVMCLRAIESIKLNVQDDSKFYRKRTAKDECYFTLKSVNGKILGISKLFENKASRENAIQWIKSVSINAPIVDYLKKPNKTMEESF